MTCTLSNSVINKYISFHVTEQSKYFFRLRVIIQQSINTVFFSKIKMIFIRKKIILMFKIRFDELLNGRKWNLYNGYIGIKDESAWIRFFFFDKNRRSKRFNFYSEKWNSSRNSWRRLLYSII